MYFILNLQQHKTFEKKTFLLDFVKNDFSTKNQKYYTNIFCYNFFEKNSNFKKLIYVVSNLFLLNKNVLFIDSNVNYNYLPIDNKLLFSRSFKKLSRIVRYFNVAVIFYVDLSKKKFIFKKLYNCNVINVSLTNSFVSKKFDLNLNIINNYLYTYLFYLLVINLYLNIKNN